MPEVTLSELQRGDTFEWTALIDYVVIGSESGKVIVAPEQSRYLLEPDTLVRVDSLSFERIKRERERAK